MYARTILTIASLTLVAAAPALAQVSYSRAEQLLSWNTDKLVSGDQVNPQWMKDGNRFWYRNKLADGAEFVLIDPVANGRRLLFDHMLLQSRCRRRVTQPSTERDFHSKRSSSRTMGTTKMKLNSILGSGGSCATLPAIVAPWETRLKAISPTSSHLTKNKKPSSATTTSTSERAGAQTARNSDGRSKWFSYGLAKCVLRNVSTVGSSSADDTLVTRLQEARRL